MKNKLTVFTVLIIALAVITSFSAVAQTQFQNAEGETDVSERELKNFAEAYTGVQKRYNEFNTDFAQLVNESSFDQETFQVLYQEKSMDTQEEFNSLSQSRKREFEQLVSSIQEMQRGFEEDMVDVIEDVGLSVQKFNSIISQIQQDPELFKRYEEIRNDQG